MGSLDRHYQSGSSGFTVNTAEHQFEPVTPEQARVKNVKFFEETDRRKSSLMRGPAPDGGWGWMIVLGSFMCNLLIIGIGLTTPVLMIHMEKTFPDYTQAEFMWVGSLQLSIYYIIGPLVSAMIIKYGCRKVTMAGAVVAVSGFLISTQSHSLAVMIVTYGFIGGIGFGMIYLPSIVIVGHWFEKRRAFATGIAVCGSGVGSILLPRLATYLYTEYTWQGGVVILAGLLLHCSFFGSLFRPLQATKSPRSRRGLMHHGSIMSALIEAKKRDRTISSGSLDNCLITHDNRIVVINPGLRSGAILKLRESLAPGSSAHSLSRSRHTIVMNRILQTATVCSAAINDNSGRPPRLKSAIPQRLLSPLAASVSPEAPHAGVIAHSYDDIVVTDKRTKRSPSRGDSSSPRLGVKSHSYNVITNPLDDDGTVIIVDDAAASTSVRSHGDGGDETHHLTRLHHVRLLGTHTDGGYYSVPVSRSNSAMSLRQRLTRSTRSLSDSNQVIPAVLVGSSLNSLPHYSCSSTMDSDYYDDDVDQSLWSTFKDIMNEYFATGLLKSYTFLLTVVVFSLCSMGMLAPIIFLPLHARNVLYEDPDSSLDKDVQDHIAIVQSSNVSFLIAILGVSDMVGRLVSGWLGDRLWIDSLHLTNVCTVIGGLLTCFMPCFTMKYEVMAAYGACVGLCMSVSITLRPIILVDLFGIHRLASSFGLFVFFLGIVTLAQPFLIKLLIHAEDFCGIFYVGGTFMILSGLFGLPLRKVRDWENKRCEHVEMTIEEVNFEESTQSDRELIPESV